MGFNGKIVEYMDNNSETLNPLASLAFGAIAGMLGQSSSYPLDIVRRRMQTDMKNEYHSIIHTLKTIYRWVNRMFMFKNSVFCLFKIRAVVYHFITKVNC